MKKFLSTAKWGFIDPISLITLGFLLVGLVVTTSIVKNPNISLDIRNWARMIEDTDDTSIRSTRSTQPAKTTQAPVQTTPDQPSSQQDETPSQPETPVTPAEVRLEKKLCQAEGGTWKNNQCQFPTHPEQKPSPSPTAVPLPKCSSFGSCYPNDYTCEKSYGQLNCGSGNKCGVHCSAPSPSPSPSPSPTSACSGTCRWGYSSCSNGGWQAASGSCPAGAPAVCCGGTLIDYCTRGSNYCVNTSTVAVCKADKSGYTTTACAANSRCSTDRCVPIPSPSPNTITQADCNKCLQTNTPSECAGVCKNIGGTITTPLGQTECTAGEKFCSGNNLKICSNSGTWGLQTCANGCANSACKPPPAAPAIPESVYYTSGALPPQLAAVNPAGDPLSLTQDPMMAATLNQKIQDCLNQGFSQSQCTQAFQNAANTKDTCVAFYMLENPNSDVAKTTERCTQERATAALIAAGAYGASQIPAATLLNTANFADDTVTIAACLNGDQNACAYVLPAITNPIPGMSLASQYADELAALSKTISASATNLFDDLAWMRNLPNADNPAGWTLGTYGGQTVLPSGNLTVTNAATTGTTFADDALLSVINNQYVSGGGTQKVIIDPINDPYLAQYLDEAQLFINSQRTSQRVSRVPLAQQFVTKTFPGYSGTNIPRSVIEETMATQQSIYRQGGGTAYLGEFINCQAGVCREQSLILHNVLANSGKPSEVVTGYLGSGGKHAWVEFTDSITGQRMVADSVWDFVLPIEEAYQIYGGVSNITSRVFVMP